MTNVVLFKKPKKAKARPVKQPNFEIIWARVPGGSWHEVEIFTGEGEPKRR